MSSDNYVMIHHSEDIWFGPYTMIDILCSSMHLSIFYIPVSVSYCCVWTKWHVYNWPFCHCLLDFKRLSLLLNGPVVAGVPFFSVWYLWFSPPVILKFGHLPLRLYSVHFRVINSCRITLQLLVLVIFFLYKVTEETTYMRENQ